ncbi:MAG: c-type cytochrome [Alphaproteobacteria bacterium]
MAQSADRPRRAVPGRRLALAASLVVAMALAAGGAVLWFSADEGGADHPPIDTDDVRQVALGRTVYAEHCAACHGADLEGEPDWRRRRPDGRLPAPPHDESGHTWHHSDEWLFAVTKYGLAPIAPEGYESDMPAYEGILSDAEIAAVLAFIKSRWPAEIRARQGGHR